MILSTLLMKETVSWYIYIYIRNFDFTMGSYDGAEACELSGIFIFSC